MDSKLNRPNRYEYLGFNSIQLDARSTARCPSCCPPDAGGVATDVICVSPFNVPVSGNNSYIIPGTRNNYTLLHDGLVWTETGYSDGNGYKNLTAYDACDGRIVKDINTFATTGRYLSGLGMEIDANGILWCQMVTTAAPSEKLWLNYNVNTDVITQPAGMTEGGSYRIDDSRIVNDTAHSSVWIETVSGSAFLTRRNINTSVEDISVACNSSDFPELDTVNYRMWIINTNAALGDIKIYNAATGVLLQTITTTTPAEDPFWAFYNPSRDEMVINYSNIAGPNVSIYDGATYALKITKITGYYGTNTSGRVLAYISTTNEYVMVLENSSTGTIQLIFLDADTLDVNVSYTPAELSGDSRTKLMTALLSDSISAYTIVCYTGYWNNRLVRIIRP